MPSLKEIRKSDSFNSDPYSEICEKCQTKVTVYSQGNWESCEYKTTVFMPCPKCKNLIDFTLPVN